MQTGSLPYRPAGFSNAPNSQPAHALGPVKPLSPVGGVPAIQNTFRSPSAHQAAQHVRSFGRGHDTMLVHMTPEEVNSLRGLAQRFGGDLTVNPDTGLPEAGWLGKLLPTILGIAGAAFGIPTWAIGLGVGAGNAAITGDLGKGLMAGLQAFGGAGLGHAAGLGGAAAGAGNAAHAATGAANTAKTVSAVSDAANVAHGAAQAAQAASNTAALAPKAPGFLDRFAEATSLGQKGMLGKALPFMAGSSVLGAISDATAPRPINLAKEEKYNYVPMGPGKREVRFQSPEEMRRTEGAEFQFFTPSNPPPQPLYGERKRFASGGVAAPPTDSSFNDLVRYFGSVSPGPITASMYPVSSVANPSPSAPAPSAPPIMGGETVHNFNRTPEGVYSPTIGFPGLSGFFGQTGPFGLGSLPGAAAVAQTNRRRRTPSLGVATARIPRVQDEPMYEVFAKGGPVTLRNGAFVLDARTVSEIGNGSSSAGIELLSRMGGQPVRGGGDGVSDSVKASIDGVQEARVARDEVIFQPEALRRLGGGSEARGTQKLYDLMDKAHKARQRAKRGQDTKLREVLHDR